MPSHVSANHIPTNAAAIFAFPPQIEVPPREPGMIEGYEERYDLWLEPQIHPLGPTARRGVEYSALND
jgi:hypothetical protein